VSCWYFFAIWGRKIDGRAGDWTHNLISWLPVRSNPINGLRIWHQTLRNSCQLSTIPLGLSSPLTKPIKLLNIWWTSEFYLYHLKSKTDTKRKIPSHFTKPLLTRHRFFQMFAYWLKVLKCVVSTLKIFYANNLGTIRLLFANST